MVTRGLWNLHVNGKWWRWFYPPRADSTSPDAPSTRGKIRQILARSDTLNWKAAPFPAPLHFQLDYVYTIDEDAGHLTVTEWRNVDEALLPRTRRATLASILETSLNAIDTLLDEVQVHEQDDYRPSSCENTVQHLLKSFNVASTIPAMMNELQFQLFTDFVFLWRKTYTEEIPIGFCSVPRWKALNRDPFWFHGYLVVYCNTNEIGASVATKANAFLSRFPSQASNTGTAHWIAISIRHVALFSICNGNVLHSPPIPLVVNTSALRCSPGFRILTYIFSSPYRWTGASNSREYWRVSLPPELFDMILQEVAPSDLVSFAQASFLVDKWYYSSIPQIYDLKLQSSALSIPCCGKRHAPGTSGLYCSVCYSWSHVECTDLSSTVPSETDDYICSICHENRPCFLLERGGINQTYRAKRGREACEVVHNGKPEKFQLRLNRPPSHRPELWLIRRNGPPPPPSVEYTIYFNGTFSGLAYGFD
ncbi:hypothetical protein BJX99DRAFT_250594 [Aspergillus californicus]